MSFESALIEQLKTIAGFGGRVYPLNSPQANAGGGIPYCIIVSSDGLRTKTINGYQQSRQVSGEINIVTKPDYSDLKSLQAAVIDLLVSFQGNSISGTGPYIQEITYEEPVEMYEEAPKLYRCLISFEVYY